LKEMASLVCIAGEPLLAKEKAARSTEPMASSGNRLSLGGGRSKVSDDVHSFVVKGEPVAQPDGGIGFLTAIGGEHEESVSQMRESRTEKAASSLVAKGEPLAPNDASSIKAVGHVSGSSKRRLVSKSPPIDEPSRPKTTSVIGSSEGPIVRRLSSSSKLDSDTKLLSKPRSSADPLFVPLSARASYPQPSNSQVAMESPTARAQTARESHRARLVPGDVKLRPLQEANVMMLGRVPTSRQQAKPDVVKQYVQDFRVNDLEVLLNNLATESSSSSRKGPPASGEAASRGQSAMTQATTLPSLRVQSPLDGRVTPGSTAEGWRRVLLSAGSKSPEGRSSPLPSSRGLRPRTVAVGTSALTEAADSFVPPVRASDRATTAPQSPRLTKLPQLAGLFGVAPAAQQREPSLACREASKGSLAAVCQNLERRLSTADSRKGAEAGSLPPASKTLPTSAATQLKDMWTCERDLQFVPTKRQARARAR